MLKLKIDRRHPESEELEEAAIESDADIVMVPFFVELSSLSQYYSSINEKLQCKIRYFFTKILQLSRVHFS